MKRETDQPARRARAAPGQDASEDDANPRVAAFLRGVTIGALVGAAIAGSALWERAARRRDEAARRADTNEDPSAN